MTRWLILVAILAALALLGYLGRLVSTTSTRRIPPPSTNLEPVVTSMMTTLESTVTSMTTSLDSSVTRMTEMVERLTLGREKQSTEPTEIETTRPEIPTTAEMWREVDQTPLSPGLEEILQREADEEYRAHLLRGRMELASRLAVLRTEATEAGVDLDDLRGLSEEQ